MKALPLTAFLLCAAAPPVTFTPLAPEFGETADFYRDFWQEEGARIIAALERESGFAFPDRPLEIILRDGPPMTGYGCTAIRLRGTYTGPVAVGTLIHELGHCLTAQMPRVAGLDDHRMLYLFLYDAWTELYGREFADRMVRLERRILDRYNYDAAWTWALRMTRAERQARLRALRVGRQAPRPSATSRTPRPAASSSPAAAASGSAASPSGPRSISGDDP